MIFSKNYNKYIKFANHLAAPFKIYFTGTDLVNEAFANIGDVDDDDLIKKEINKVFTHERSLINNSFDETYSKQFQAPAETEKHCKGCDEVLPMTAFYLKRYKNGKIWVSHKCINCIKKINREWMRTHPQKKIKKQSPEKRRETLKRYYEKNKEKMLAYSREYQRRGYVRTKKNMKRAAKNSSS